MPGPARIVVLVLLDMCHHLKLLSLYVTHHLITCGIQCVALSHLSKEIIKRSPDSGIIIPPTGLVSEGRTCKSVRNTVRGVWVCKGFGSTMLKIIIIIFSVMALINLSVNVIARFWGI